MEDTCMQARWHKLAGESWKVAQAAGVVAGLLEQRQGRLCDGRLRFDCLDRFLELLLPFAIWMRETVVRYRGAHEWRTAVGCEIQL